MMFVLHLFSDLMRFLLSICLDTMSHEAEEYDEAFFFWVWLDMAQLKKRTDFLLKWGDWQKHILNCL
jgi:hypothetical protein